MNSTSVSDYSGKKKKVVPKKDNGMILETHVLKLRSAMSKMKKKMDEDHAGEFEKMKKERLNYESGHSHSDSCINDSLTVLSSVSLENGSEKIMLSFRATEVRLEGKDDELIISGTALTEGAFQGKGMNAPVKFDSSFLEKVAPKFVGVPLMYAHSDRPGDIVGKVVSSVYNAAKKVIEFVAKIRAPDAIWKVKDGLLGAVSVGMNLTSAKVDQGVKSAIDADAIELSLVRQPACPGCLINKVGGLTNE